MIVQLVTDGRSAVVLSGARVDRDAAAWIGREVDTGARLAVPCEGIVTQRLLLDDLGPVHGCLRRSGAKLPPRNRNQGGTHA
jgi:hypothetical protein